MQNTEPKTVLQEEIGRESVVHAISDLFIIEQVGSTE
jgi:hypothetical protein